MTNSFTCSWAGEAASKKGSTLLGRSLPGLLPCWPTEEVVADSLGGRSRRKMVVFLSVFWLRLWRVFSHAVAMGWFNEAGHQRGLVLQIDAN